ncbi:MAG: Lysine exporter protein [Gemmatimonadetes bacterium]|nr:Lysine exporter protein [Gemmatimonadota bacterium]
MLPDIRTLLLFLSAGLALNLAPGPDMLYVATRSASEGRKAGLVSALGIGTGCLVHISLLAAGLAVLLERVPLAYDLVRLSGAGYLAWLGIRALRSRVADVKGADAVARPTASLWSIYRQGVITNVLNPKVALFFLAFFPQFIDPARGSTVAQIFTLGLLFDVQGMLVLMVIVLGASSAASRLRNSGPWKRRLDRATGVIFLGLGARLAFAGMRRASR